MTNITVAVPDEVYRAAKIRAAERGTSVSALVAGYLASLSAARSEFERLQAKQHRIQLEIDRFRASDHIDRDRVHERAIRRHEHPALQCQTSGSGASQFVVEASEEC